MKKYDKKEIMRTAWRTYKYTAKKNGKTFAEVLKSTWRLAKLQYALKSMEEKPAKANSEVAVKPKKAEAYDWGCFTAEDIYPSNSRGYMGAKYCGD